jgi:succinate-acetate transporter protein
MQVDLKPTEYRKKNPRSGRWQFRDNPRLCFAMMIVALGMLAWFFAGRDEMSREVLFGVTALFAFGAGGMFALWLKDY